MRPVRVSDDIVNMKGAVGSNSVAACVVIEIVAACGRQ